MRSKLEYDVYVCTSLVDMYIWWFYNMGFKSLGCYTAMSSVGDREKREKKKEVEGEEYRREKTEIIVWLTTEKKVCLSDYCTN